jgi:hypothetical protein
VLIACVSPSELSLDESINTLRYAERSRSITNTSHANVVALPNSAALWAENQLLREQVQLLEQQLQATQHASIVSTRSDSRIPTTASASWSETRAKAFMDAEFAGLREKLQRAEEEARQARDHAKLVWNTADKWRSDANIIAAVRRYFLHCFWPL